MNKFYVLVGSNINPHENVNEGLDLIKKNNEIVECEVCSTSVHAKFSIQCSLKKLKFLNNKDGYHL